MFLSALFQQALLKAIDAGQLPPEIMTLPIEFEQPRDVGHGDWSTTFALQAAKAAKCAPRRVADILVGYFDKTADDIDAVEVAGPGFINFRMKPSFWFESLREVCAAPELYGKGTIGEGKRALVEFVSANPTGPLHIGHGRGAVVGDTMASILEWAGYAVEREYYVNDGGVQMGMLGASIAGRYDELQGKTGTFPENGYRGDYIYAIARDFAKDDRYADMSAEERIQAMGESGGARILSEIMEDLKALGVVFDRVFYESSLYKQNKVAATLERLRQAGLTYEQDNALWFATERFGDDKDRVLKKSDGSYTYFAPDIAYHCDKLARGYVLLVDVWGADHGGYAPRMQAALKALEARPESLQVMLIQMVQLISGGARVSMSTRAGEFEELAAVRTDVGKDATRYFFLMRSHQAQLDFDLDLAKKRSAENPVYYIQYAHARIASVFRKAGRSREACLHDSRKDFPDPGDYAFLPEEIELIKKTL
jgi:arginyl-tRNA synthetase